jgi:hypothetical protein
MEKEFIPYTEALALKELGFDKPCLGFYDGKGDTTLYFNNKRDASGDFETFINNKRLTWFGAPTFSQAFRWFREKYGLYSWIQLHNGYINDSFYSELPITFSIMDRKTGNKYYERDIPHNYLYKTNEEAETTCLEKLFEIVEGIES